MLQLPTNTTTARHFTKAEIADITRDAKAVKACKHKPDLLTQRIAAVKKAIERDDVASAAFLAVKEKLSEENALEVSLWVDATGARQMCAVHTSFYSLKQIDTRARQVMRSTKEVLAFNRANLRKGSEFGQEERARFIKKLVANIKDIPKQCASIKRNFKKEKRRVRGVQRRHHYQTLATRRDEARRRMTTAYKAVLGTAISSREDALAMIEFCSFILECHSIWSYDVPKMLARARKVLAKG